MLEYNNNMINILGLKLNKKLLALLVVALFLGIFKQALASDILVECQDGNVFSPELEGRSVPEAITYWQTRPHVKLVEANPSFKIAVIPTDYYIANQWYLKRIKAPQAWDIIREAPAVTVAVIDSGVQIKHQDLKDNIWVNVGEIPANGLDDDRNGYIDDVNGYDFVNKMADPSPKFMAGFTPEGVTHGTVVAGILGAAGNNTIGISGVAWQVNIMPLKAIDDKGETKADKVVEAINYAVHNKAQIINLSFIGSGYSKALEEAIKRAYDAGVVVVAAGGNDLAGGHGQDLDKQPMYPVCFKGRAGENLVIGVAASNALDEKASFSGYGKQCIDILAPGMSIFSTTVYAPKYHRGDELFDKYYDGYWSGTSLAVPQVSAALALVMQANPGLQPREAVDVLLSSADSVYNKNETYYGLLGSGRLNVYQAVVNAQARRSPYVLNLLAANSGALGEVKIYRQGRLMNQFSAFASSTAALVAGGDVDGDGWPEIVAVPRSGAKPEVKIFNWQGKLEKTWLAFPESFKGGLNVAVGDLNNDDQVEIIIGAGVGTEPIVKIFNASGKLQKSFLAYDAAFRGGVKVAVGELGANNTKQIVTVPASAGPAQVRVFSTAGKVMSQFFAYDAKIKGSFNVVIADTRGLVSREASIAVTTGKGLEPYVSLFSTNGRLVRRFAAYNLSYLGGVNLSAGDVNQDGLDELIVAPGPGGTPNMAWYSTNGRLLGATFAADKNNKNGVNLGIFYSK
jgi:subtilisin family serine protease